MNGYSIKTPGGVLIHYDNNRNITGSTKPSFGSGVVHYDADGEKIGFSRGGGHGYMHYDLNYIQTGYSKKSLGKGYVHYNMDNEIIGYSSETPSGYIHSNNI